jgi:ribosomal protein L11 methyltransferase
VPGCDPQLQDLVLAELDDFQPTAIQEQDDTSRLRAFFTSRDARAAAARTLATSFGTHLFVEAIDVEDDDWAARSQAQLRSVTIGRLIIAPPWDAPDHVGVSREAHEEPLEPRLVVIQPSMGFGTGHHATTRIVLKALQHLRLQDQTVLDIGCGSGILAIAAVALGARSAIGIDIDPDALANAGENVDLNRVGGRVRLEEGDFRAMPLRAGLVLANLTGALLERSATTLAALVEPGGFLVASGFTESERASVVPALERVLALQTLAQEEEWMCGVFAASR